MEKEQKIMVARIVASGAMLGFVLFLPLSEMVRMCLCLAAYLIIGADVIYEAVESIFHKELFDEHFLMAIATVGALAIGEYPEAVAVMFFYQIGELFSDIALERSRASISSLMDIRPDYANLEDSAGTVRKVSPSDVPQGSIIMVKPGEKIPIDGVVISGESSLDTAALTGESMPRDVSEGAEVLSGSLNMTGLLRIKTTSSFGESTVSKILDLVENAQTGKAKTEKFITRFARVYTPSGAGDVKGSQTSAAGNQDAFGSLAATLYRRRLACLAAPCTDFPGYLLSLRTGHFHSSHFLRRYRWRIPKGDSGKGFELYGSAFEGAYHGLRQDRHPY